MEGRNRMAASAAPLSPRQTAWRLFLTCWILYVLHFATDVVREHYPALALADHASFRLDEYGGLHPDLFETPGRGWHIGNNPGVSMLAAIPYLPFKPIVDAVSRRVVERRRASGQTEPPTYDTEWANARRFYAEAWRRGLDIKLGLAAFIMQAFCMAPATALAVVLMFAVFRRLFRSDRAALWLSLVYAFATPVFFRTGFLNHNLMLGHIAFAGFVALWDPWDALPWRLRTRFMLAGLAGGTAILFDYTGVVFIVALGLYGFVKRGLEENWNDGFRHGLWYVVGTLPPVLLLWFYQWQAFGNPFLPGQHWMPPVEWIDRGYQGFSGPQPDVLWMLLGDHRFGLFVTAPLLALALLCPWVERRERRVLPRFEMWAMLLLFLALYLFFSGNNYTRLQFNTGIRYMTAIFPFLMVPAAVVLVRAWERRPRLAWFLVLGALTINWPLAMYREVEKPLGVLDPVVRTLTGGPALPALNTLKLTGDQFGDFFTGPVTPLALFALTAAVIFGLWFPRFRRQDRP